MRILVGLGALLAASSAMAADLAPRVSRAEETVVVERVREVRVRTHRACVGCWAPKLPYGGLRQTHAPKLPYGGLRAVAAPDLPYGGIEREECLPVRRTRTVVISSKG